MTTIYLFNTSIAPTPGLVYHLRSVSAEQARMDLHSHDAAGGTIVSAIGHESTAQAMSTILGYPVEVNRINAQMQPGDKAIILRIRGRLPEGQILDAAALDAIGFDFQIMTAESPEPAERVFRKMLHLELLATPDFTGPASEQPKFTRRPVQMPQGYILRGDSERYYLSYRDDGAGHQVMRDIDEAEAHGWETFTPAPPMTGVIFDGSGRHGAGFDDPLTVAQKEDFSPSLARAERRLLARGMLRAMVESCRNDDGLRGLAECMLVDVAKHIGVTHGDLGATSWESVLADLARFGSASPDPFVALLKHAVADRIVDVAGSDKRLPGELG